MEGKKLRLVVEVDIPVTRRRRIHQAGYPREPALYHSQTIGDLLRWLVDNEHHEIVIVDGEHEYLISLSVPPWQH